MKVEINSARIIQAMVEQGIGVRETCVRSRVNHKTFTKLLDGKMVRVDSIGRVAKTLDIPVRELILSGGNNAATFEKEERPLKLVSAGRAKEN